MASPAFALVGSICLCLSARPLSKDFLVARVINTIIQDKMPLCQDQHHNQQKNNLATITE